MKQATQINPSQIDCFCLSLGPDGVYRVDGRVIPVRDEARIGVDHSKPVVPIKNLSDMGVGLLGRHSRADIEQRQLELVPSP